MSLAKRLTLDSGERHVAPERRAKKKTGRGAAKRFGHGGGPSPRLGPDMPGQPLGDWRLRRLHQRARWAVASASARAPLASPIEGLLSLLASEPLQRPTRAWPRACMAPRPKREGAAMFVVVEAAACYPIIPWGFSSRPRRGRRRKPVADVSEHHSLGQPRHRGLFATPECASRARGE